MLLYDIVRLREVCTRCRAEREKERLLEKKKDEARQKEKEKKRKQEENCEIENKYLPDIVVRFTGAPVIMALP